MNTTRSLLLATSMACMTLLSGCLSGSTDVVSVTGVYDLQTINNTALPFSFTGGATVVAEELTLNADGTFTDVTTRADGSVVSDLGAYNKVGGTVNFADATAGLVYQGQVQGSTLTTVIGSFSMYFIRTGAATH